MAKDFFIKTNNKFDMLSNKNDGDTVSEFEIQFDKVEYIKLKNREKSKPRNKKYEVWVFDSLKQFKTSNRFDV